MFFFPHQGTGNTSQGRWHWTWSGTTKALHRNGGQEWTCVIRMTTQSTDLALKHGKGRRGKDTQGCCPKKVAWQAVSCHCSMVISWHWTLCIESASRACSNKRHHTAEMPCLQGRKGSTRTLGKVLVTETESPLQLMIVSREPPVLSHWTDVMMRKSVPKPAIREGSIWFPLQILASCKGTSTGVCPMEQWWFQRLSASKTKNIPVTRGKARHQ